MASSCARCRAKRQKCDGFLPQETVVVFSIQSSCVMFHDRSDQTHFYMCAKEWLVNMSLGQTDCLSCVFLAFSSTVFGFFYKSATV